MKSKFNFFGVLILIILFFVTAFSQDTETDEIELTAEELNKKTQNPILSIISLPFQLNFNLGMGEYDRMQTG